ncbi:MAG: single-stranded DNA-binding protein [Ruminococcaceae bacterium]|nr:single-stranded DNA-binding protein [Oscillospiraceae bacterium]
MIGSQCTTNIAKISGVIMTAPTFGHEVYGEGFYYFLIKVKRLSDSCDIIPVTVSERLADCNEYQVGRYIEVSGQFRSYNASTGSGSAKLMLSVFAQDVVFCEEESRDMDTNYIELDGFICKPPVYRTTPFKREITDFLLAVNRSYNKSDYIPCISWGRNARFCGKRTVGENVKVIGRIQSRTYEKKFPDGTSVKKTAYEISVAKIELRSEEVRENVVENTDTIVQ